MAKNGWKVKVGEHPEKFIEENRDFDKTGIVASWDDAVSQYKRELNIGAHEGPVNCEYVNNGIKVTPPLVKSFASNTKPDEVKPGK